LHSKLSPLHFVGIGGIGMAALAELLHAQGLEVSGSDLVAGATFERLRGLGVRVSIGHDASSVEGATTVIRSSAIALDNPEIEAAREAGIAILGRGALLAEIMRHKEAIAIGGSHGKTTTSAITAHVLESAGLDPTALIGGRVPRQSGGASPTRLGGSELIVAEVDESDGSFLLTDPTVAVLTNIDPEHLDHYGSHAALLEAFVEFANSVPATGACLLGIDHPGIQSILPRVTARKVSFGFGSEADVRAKSVEAIAGGQRCLVELRTGDTFVFDLPMPGRHNILNALAAIAVGLFQEIEPNVMADAIATFPGVARRFERKGIAGGIEVVDDYAHHPAEIRAALAGARSVHAGPITAIFQPHRFTRTRDCWDDFLVAFGDADRVVIAEIYPASESPIPGIDGTSLAEALANAGHRDAHFGGSLDDIARDWPTRFESSELILTLGAGDVVQLGPRLLASRKDLAAGGCA
jgi:UDP-N-acetylmuramate--alanine ligase